MSRHPAEMSNDEFSQDIVNESRNDIVEIQPNNNQVSTFLRKYKLSKLKISPLSVHEYHQLLNDKNPEMKLIQQFPAVENEPNFIKFDEITEAQKTAVKQLETSFRNSKNYWQEYKDCFYSEKKGKFSRIQSEPSEFSITSKNSSSQSIHLQLQHNKQTLESIRKLSKQKQETEYNEYQLINKKINDAKQLQKKVKNYPSKIYQDAQKIEILKRKINMGEGSMNTYVLPKEENLGKSETILEAKTYCHVYSSINTSWGPNSREGATLNSFNNNLYLFGGTGVNISDEIIIAETQLQYYKWTKPAESKSFDKSQQLMRSNHTSSIYKNQLIIFGGEIHLERNEQKIRECVNDIKIINLCKQIHQLYHLASYEVKQYKQTGIVEARKGHTSFIIGRHLLIHGGISNRGIFLNDLLIYDIHSQKWSGALIQKQKLYDLGIAYHTSCLVASQFHRSLEIYKQIDEKAANQGVYFFGGIDSQNNLISDLLLLHFDTKPLHFSILPSLGKVPEPRYKHSMTFNELLNVIVIFGGINKDSIILNDLNILDVKSLTWQLVILNGKSLINRCSHCQSTIQTKLYIFGGYNEQGYVSTDLTVIEMESGQAKKLGDKIVKVNEIQKHKSHQDSGQEQIIFSAQEYFEKQKDNLKQIKEKEQEQLKKRHELIQSLSFRSVNSYLPMPRINPNSIYILKQLGLIKPERKSLSRKQSFDDSKQEKSPEIGKSQYQKLQQIQQAVKSKTLSII